MLVHWLGWSLKDKQVHKKEGVSDDEGPRKVVYVFACTSCIFKHTMCAEPAKFLLCLCILQSIH